MNSFRTEIYPHKPDFDIQHQDGIMLNGSCFSENLGNLFRRCRFNVDINSHGIIYNPESLAGAFDDLLNQKVYNEDDLIFHNGVFHSVHHHGRFSNAVSEVVLESVNSAIESSAEFLRKSKLIFVTFGSAWIYRLKETNKVVANCHKLPGSDFSKSLMTHLDIEQRWRELFIQLFKLNDNLKVVMTVSPVRHWRDGFMENQISKAHLLIAASKLTDEFRNVSYFPSYELLMDDLRDYRFYNQDMLHPNELAIEYVWKKLSDWCFDDKTKMLLTKIEPLIKFIEHKPMKTDLDVHISIVERKQKEINALITQSNKSYNQ